MEVKSVLKRKKMVRGNETQAQIKEAVKYSILDRILDLRISGKILVLAAVDHGFHCFYIPDQRNKIMTT